MLRSSTLWQRAAVASCALMCGILASAPVYALNYFELEVYPYQTAARGEIEIENRTLYTDQGTKDAAPPDNNQGLTRSSFELNYGLTDKTEIAAYYDTQRANGGSFHDAGYRVRARTRFYEKGELPIDLGLYAEYEVPSDGTHTHDLELRGILEKDVERWTFDFNPIFEKQVSGDVPDEGWELQYAASVNYRMDEHWRPRLDFFGDFGPIRHFDDHQDQKHLVSPGIDYRFGRDAYLSFGVAYGLTDASERRLLRARLEYEFY